MRLCDVEPGIAGSSCVAVFALGPEQGVSSRDGMVKRKDERRHAIEGTMEMDQA